MSPTQLTLFPLDVSVVMTLPQKDFVVLGFLKGRGENILWVLEDQTKISFLSYLSL